MIFSDKDKSYHRNQIQIFLWYVFLSKKIILFSIQKDHFIIQKDKKYIEYDRNFYYRNNT